MHTSVCICGGSIHKSMAKSKRAAKALQLKPSCFFSALAFLHANGIKYLNIVVTFEIHYFVRFCERSKRVKVLCPNTWTRGREGGTRCCCRHFFSNFSRITEHITNNNIVHQQKFE